MLENVPILTNFSWAHSIWALGTVIFMFKNVFLSKCEYAWFIYYISSRVSTLEKLHVWIDPKANFHTFNSIAAPCMKYVRPIFLNKNTHFALLLLKINIEFSSVIVVTFSKLQLHFVFYSQLEIVYTLDARNMFNSNAFNAQWNGWHPHIILRWYHEGMKICFKNISISPIVDTLYPHAMRTSHTASGCERFGGQYWEERSTNCSRNTRIFMQVCTLVQYTC